MGSLVEFKKRAVNIDPVLKDYALCCPSCDHIGWALRRDGAIECIKCLYVLKNTHWGNTL